MTTVVSSSSQDSLLQSVLREPLKTDASLDRELCFQALQKTGLPHRRFESWKYTNPRPLFDTFENDGSTSESATLDGTPIEERGFEGLDRDRIERQLAAAHDYERSPFAALNGLLVDRRKVIVVDESATTTCTLCIPASGGVERWLVVVAAGASVEIEETIGGGNRVIECLIGEGASVRHDRTQAEERRPSFGLTVIDVATSGTYTMSQASCGSALQRNEVVVNLNGKGAKTTLTAGWHTAADEVLDNQFTVNHNQPGGESRQLCHGVTDELGRTVFNGRIYIARGAYATDAQLDNKNVANGLQAQIFAKPELEIYADDVVCTHGSTIGQLDLNMLYYLRTRGLDDRQSRALLVRGLLNNVVRTDRGRAAVGLGT